MLANLPGTEDLRDQVLSPLNLAFKDNYQARDSLGVIFKGEIQYPVDFCGVCECFISISQIYTQLSTSYIYMKLKLPDKYSFNLPCFLLLRVSILKPYNRYYCNT